MVGCLRWYKMKCLSSNFFVADNYVVLFMTFYACLATCQDVLSILLWPGKSSLVFSFPTSYRFCFCFLPLSILSNFLSSLFLLLLIRSHLFSAAQVVEKGQPAHLFPTPSKSVLPFSAPHKDWPCLSSFSFSFSPLALPYRVKPNGANPSKEGFDDETNKAATSEKPCRFSEACWTRLAAKVALFDYFSV